MASDELPLYTSFDEEVADCVLCAKNVDEPINYGEKLCSLDVTAHFYCLVDNVSLHKYVNKYWQIFYKSLYSPF